MKAPTLQVNVEKDETFFTTQKKGDKQLQHSPQNAEGKPKGLLDAKKIE